MSGSQRQHSSAIQGRAFESLSVRDPLCRLNSLE